jgi:hypothetical protein
MQTWVLSTLIDIDFTTFARITRLTFARVVGNLIFSNKKEKEKKVRKKNTTTTP